VRAWGGSGWDNHVVTAAVRVPLTADTPLDVEAVQNELWRRMSVEAKADLISDICVTLDEMVTEGIARRHLGAPSIALVMHW
jgi:hypothetical protein